MAPSIKGVLLEKANYYENEFNLILLENVRTAFPLKLFHKIIILNTPEQ